MPTLSTLLDSLEESATLRLTNEARTMAASGQDVISLTAGEPDFPTPASAREAALQAVQSDFTRYTPTAGIPELLDAVVQKFERDNGLQYSRDSVLVSAGAKQSIYHTLRVICNPGDEVIFFRPYWVSYPALVRLAGGVPVVVPPENGKGFRPSLRKLRDSITPRSKALLLNSPCNPTGTVMSREELMAIAELARAHDLFVISDEVYETMVFDGRKHLSIAALPGMMERTVTVNSISKSYSMPGWRIGFLGGPPEVAAAARRVQGHTQTCVNSIAQKAAAGALNGGARERAAMAFEFESRRNAAYTQLQADARTRDVGRPEGAMFFFLPVSEFLGGTINGVSIQTDIELATHLLRQHRVGTVPGSAFGEPGHLRLSFSSSLPTIQEGIRRYLHGVSGRTHESH